MSVFARSPPVGLAVERANDRSALEQDEMGAAPTESDHSGSLMSCSFSRQEGAPERPRLLSLAALKHRLRRTHSRSKGRSDRSNTEQTTGGLEGKLAGKTKELMGSLIGERRPGARGRLEETQGAAEAEAEARPRRRSRVQKRLT